MLKNRRSWFSNKTVGTQRSYSYYLITRCTIVAQEGKIKFPRFAIYDHVAGTAVPLEA